MPDKCQEVCNKYDKIAGWFQKTRDDLPFVEKPYFELIANKLNKNASILDLGCGTGKPIAQFFIEKGFELIGVDGSKEMIDICKQSFPKKKWIVSDMRTINLNKKFDCVIAWDSFFHLNQEDQRNMFTVLLLILILMEF